MDKSVRKGSYVGRGVKKVFKVVGMVVLSFVLTVATGPESFANGLSQENVSAWAFFFFILLTWRWCGRFIKGALRLILLLIGIRI